MHSRIVGYVDVDRFVSNGELSALLDLDYHANYSAFVFGRWGNCVLWNGSGDERDCDLHEYEGVGRATPHYAKFSGIAALVDACFDVRHVRWIRLFRQDRGVLLPHVDFVGMKKGFRRLHVPLRTDIGALHSEGDEVYHMRAGEVWHLEALHVHSACNRSRDPRVTLCIDFAPEPPVELLVRLPCSTAGAARRVMMIERPAFTSEDRRALDALVPALRDGRLEDVLERLITVHFEKRVSSAEMFTWFRELALQTGRPEIADRGQELRALGLGPAGALSG
jgi:hypothetical protein